MKLTRQFHIRRSDSRWKEADHLCFLAKNLYNAALYRVKQHYLATGEYLNYYTINKLFSSTDQFDYRQLPANVSQQVLMLVEQNIKSFFALLTAKKNGRIPANTKIRFPKYLDVIKGRQVVIYTQRVIQKRYLKQELLRLTSTTFTIPIGDMREIKQARIVHKGSTIVIEVIYEVPDVPTKPDNGRYASIDPGINTLAALASNVFDPTLITGRPLKSFNQHFNKRKAYLQSQLTGGRKTSKLIRAITSKRNNKVKDYLHKASSIIVNQLVSRNVCKLAIGHNKYWKQETNIGKVNNQNFVSIPHTKFFEMLEYKCKLVGIEVIRTNEAYTSKCSFLDSEPIGKHEKYFGKRIKRGLFRSAEGKLINADINGSFNILTKVFGKFDYNSIKVCGTPKVVNPLTNPLKDKMLYFS
jgi:IS605 OrfB family transposase